MGKNTDNVEKDNPDFTFFMYRNHNDIFEKRMVRIEKLWYGQSVHYGEHDDCWFIRGFCNDRQGDRDFMMARIIGMYQWSWMTNGEHPIERPLGTAAEQVLAALYVEGTQGSTSPHTTVDEAFNRIMNALRAKGPAEPTMILDVGNTMIQVGDVVRATTDINSEMHGAWVDYKVEKAPAGYRLSYFISQTGQVLPVGYTAGYLSDQFMEKEHEDIKSMVFAQVPIRSKRLRIVNENYL